MREENKRLISYDRVLPQDFFRIQLVFARKIAEITGVSLEQAVLDNTAYYVRIGIYDWKHNKENPRWVDYWKKVQAGNSPDEAAYLMYIQSVEVIQSNPISSCFSYSYNKSDKSIHLHFQNNLASDKSPLSSDNLTVRRQELAKMFQEIHKKYPQAEVVEGSSWLYAYESYKSLFPLEFIKSLHPAEPGLKGNGIWGQFLTSRGELNHKRTEQFTLAINSAKSKDEALAAFPIPTYYASASIESFYEYFKPIT